MSSIIQIALAFIAVLVVPGFAMSLAFFPRLNQLEVTERLAISIGLSITILVTLGLLMGYSQSLINLLQPAGRPYPRNHLFLNCMGIKSSGLGGQRQA
jgi:uncharacterized membrane protein